MQLDVAKPPFEWIIVANPVLFTKGDASEVFTSYDGKQLFEFPFVSQHNPNRIAGLATFEGQNGPLISKPVTNDKIDVEKKPKKDSVKVKTDRQKRTGGPAKRGKSHELTNVYLVQDARSIAQTITACEKIATTITSPPYWDYKDYGAPDQIGHGQSLDEYLNDLVEVFSQIWKATRKDGSLWIIIKSVRKEGQLYLLPFKIAERLTQLATNAWYLQDVLIWHKTHTLPWTHAHRLQDHFEYILCFSKSSDFRLKTDAVRSASGIANWWVKYPERYHPLGKSFSNVWEIAIPTQGAWGNGDINHFCPLPQELVERIILLSTNTNDVVLDPFAGTGTTLLAAKRLNRQWVGTDVNRSFKKMFLKQLASQKSDTSKTAKSQRDFFESNLKLRQLKFSITLFKRLAPSLRIDSSDIPIIVTIGGKLESNASPSWVSGTKIYLVAASGRYQKLKTLVEKAILDTVTVAPLSKYQLAADVRFITMNELNSLLKNQKTSGFFVYERGAFWKYSRSIDFRSVSTEKPIGNLPALISNIQLTESQAF